MSTNRFAIYHPYYKKKPKITESANNLLLVRLLLKQLSLYEALSTHILKFTAYHLHRDKTGMSEFVYNPIFLRLLPKLLSLPGDPFNCIVKFGIYHLHYKEKLLSIPTRTLVYAAGCLYIGYYLGSLGNLSIVSPFAHDGGISTTKPGLVTKKREPPKTTLDLSHLL